MDGDPTDDYLPEADPSSRDQSPIPSKLALSEALQPTPLPVQSTQAPSRGFNFAALKRVNQSQSTEAPFDLTPVPQSAQRQLARKKLGALDANSHAVGNEEGGWCQRHPWSVNIRDANKRPPSHPDYDKTTLYVPSSELNSYRGTKHGGLSPFQRQFWSIKSANYDTIIFFKKGKFYELYDVDADVGHKVLGLNFTKGGRVDMRCCGVPEQAFDRHCARLVDSGYKVGRVEQTETANAAEKRKNGGGSNKSSVCERSLVRILTKATVTEDGLLRDHRARFVLAITEEDATDKMTDSDQSTTIEDGTDSVDDSVTKSLGVCYVDVASGTVNINQYEDDFRLSKTERLVTYLRPLELIVDLSKASQRLTNIVTWCTKRSGAELIDYGRKRGFPSMTEKWLAGYLRGNSDSKDKDLEYKNVCRHMRQYEVSCKAFGAMATHLKSLIIDVETLSLGNYRLHPTVGNETNDGNENGKDSGVISPAPSPRLRMDASTIQNLEVLSSTIDDSERGSLLSCLDHAHTPAGRRLIRRWLAEPFVRSEEIEDRLNAIQDIHAIEEEDGGRTLRSVLKQMKTKKDLERALPRLHRQATVNDSAVMFDDTNKRRVKEFLAVLRGLQESLCALETLAEARESIQPKSKRLKELCSPGGAIPRDAIDKLDHFLGEAFDLESAESAGEIVPKLGEIPSYDEARHSLDRVESALSQELKKWQDRLGDKSIKYYHRGKEPYQIEVKLETIRGRTPDEFEVVSESKGTKRFYTRKVKKLVREQVEASEVFELASSSVAREMIRLFDQDFNTWSAISATCAEVDALIGFAFASRGMGDGPMCRPTILANSHPKATVQAQRLRHPILAGKSESFVSNDISLGGETDPDIMVLTGPNAGGKSTLSRQVALSVVLAQVGCFVPAESFVLRPFEDIFVRMGASDDIARGRSTFMVEMEEVGNILNNANERSLVIADEVGRGTSTHDGYAVAYATLDHISKVNKSLTIFSTHYSHLGDDVVELGKQGNRLTAGLYEMAAIVDDVKKKITFLYKLRKGSSNQSRGVYCARIAGVPANVADEAEQAAMNFDNTFANRLAAMKFTSICNGIEADPIAALSTLQHS